MSYTYTVKPDSTYVVFVPKHVGIPDLSICIAPITKNVDGVWIYEDSALALVTAATVEPFWIDPDKDGDGRVRLFATDRDAAIAGARDVIAFRMRIRRSMWETHVQPYPELLRRHPTPF